MLAAVQLSLELLIRDGDAEMAEIIRTARLDLIPGQDQPLPARVSIGHHAGVTETLGDTESSVQIRSRGRRRTRYRERKQRC